MTKQDILDYFEYINIAYNNPNKYNDLSRMLDELIETQPRWIPCSERLPDKDGCYLVSTTGTNNDIIDIAYCTEEIWHKASRIKAWMPLPEPYVPDINDGKMLMEDVSNLPSKGGDMN